MSRKRLKIKMASSRRKRGAWPSWGTRRKSWPEKTRQVSSNKTKQCLLLCFTHLSAHPALILLFSETGRCHPGAPQGVLWPPGSGRLSRLPTGPCATRPRSRRGRRRFHSRRQPAGGVGRPWRSVWEHEWVERRPPLLFSDDVWRRSVTQQGKVLSRCGCWIKPNALVLCPSAGTFIIQKKLAASEFWERQLCLSELQGKGTILNCKITVRNCLYIYLFLPNWLIWYKEKTQRTH